MQKSEIRNQYRKRRLALPDEQILKISHFVSLRCIKYLKSHIPNCVAGYHSFDNEICLNECWNWCRQNSIDVVIVEKNTPIMFLGDIDIWFVPGILFSKEKDRLGFGKGVYDQLLMQHKGYKIGVGYDWKDAPDWTSDPWDIKMDHLILGSLEI